jgi:transposase
MGAISHCLKNNGYFEVHKSTKGACVIEYMTNIQRHILPEYRGKRLILIADNHSSHKGPSKIQVMNQFCEVHFIPVYSCELNGPIETAWSVIKKRAIPMFTQLQI